MKAAALLLLLATPALADGNPCNVPNPPPEARCPLVLTPYVNPYALQPGEHGPTTATPKVVNVPEPASLALLGAGLVGLALVRRMR